MHGFYELLPFLYAFNHIQICLKLLILCALHINQQTLVIPPAKLSPHPVVSPLSLGEDLNKFFTFSETGTIKRYTVIKIVGKGATCPGNNDFFNVHQ